MNYKDNIIRIENKLYKESTDRIKNQLYGYFTTLILSKVYAIKNSDLEQLMNYFDFTFLPYVYKSRTILLSRVIRILEKKDEEELNDLLEKMKIYLDQFEEENLNSTIDNNNSKNEQEEKKKRKKKNIFDDIFNQLG